MGNHENNQGVKNLPQDYDLLFFEVLKRVTPKPQMQFTSLEQNKEPQFNLPGLLHLSYH